MNSDAALDMNENLRSEQQIAKMSEVHNFSAPELDNLKILRQGTSNEKVLKTFRELRTQMYSKIKGKNFVCMVTSVSGSGGSSYVSSNLAAAIALDKSRTSVIVDGNFYRPSMDVLLSTEANLGLTDYLSIQDMGIEFVLYASGIKRVRIVPAGKNSSGATEKLSSNKMKGFLSELKSRYNDRYIVVDCPPVDEYSADVRIMASLCDFVVLVVPYGKVSNEEIQTSIDIIGKEKVAGVVFNNV